MDPYSDNYYLGPPDLWTPQSIHHTLASYLLEHTPMPSLLPQGWAATLLNARLNGHAFNSQASVYDDPPIHFLNNKHSHELSYWTLALVDKNRTASSLTEERQLEVHVWVPADHDNENDDIYNSDVVLPLSKVLTTLNKKFYHAIAIQDFLCDFFIKQIGIPEGAVRDFLHNVALMIEKERQVKRAHREFWSAFQAFYNVFLTLYMIYRVPRMKKLCCLALLLLGAHACCLLHICQLHADLSTKTSVSGE